MQNLKTVWMVQVVPSLPWILKQEKQNKTSHNLFSKKKKNFIKINCFLTFYLSLNIRRFFNIQGRVFPSLKSKFIFRFFGDAYLRFSVSFSRSFVSLTVFATNQWPSFIENQYPHSEQMFDLPILLPEMYFIFTKYNLFPFRDFNTLTWCSYTNTIYCPRIMIQNSLSLSLSRPIKNVYYHSPFPEVLTFSNFNDIRFVNTKNYYNLRKLWEKSDLISTI